MLKAKKLHGILLSATVLFSMNVLAATEPLSYGIHQQYTSTRALGMGNAFTSVVDDYATLFYNPAALAKRTEGNLHFNIAAAFDPGAIDFINDIDEASKKSNPEQEISNVIQKNYGKSYNLRPIALGGTWLRPNWGIAFLPADFSVDVSLHRQVGPALNVSAYFDTSFAYGYGKELKWGKWAKWYGGVTVKGIHRLYFNGVTSIAELVNDTQVFDQDDFDEGLTLDADVGFLIEPKMPKKGMFSWFQPTVSVVVRNLLDLGFFQNFHVVSENSNQPPQMQRRFDVGMSFDTPDIWVFDPRLAIEVRDMGHKNWSFMKGLHIGAELGWEMYSWWKGHWSVGLNQGYITYGFGALLGWFQLDLAGWGEEVGTSDNRIESRRYQLEMSLDF